MAVWLSFPKLLLNQPSKISTKTSGTTSFLFGLVLQPRGLGTMNSSVHQTILESNDVVHLAAKAGLKVVYGAGQWSQEWQQIFDRMAEKQTTQRFSQCSDPTEMLWWDLQRQMCINKCPQTSMKWSNAVKKSGLKSPTTTWPTESYTQSYFFKLLMLKVNLWTVNDGADSGFYKLLMTLFLG